MSAYHAPGDWLANSTSARDRRSAAAWLLIISVLLTPISYRWKDAVWMVWLLSILAIYISLLGTAAAETPVEDEDSGGPVGVRT